MTMIYGIPTLMEYSDNAVLFRFCAEQGYRFAEMNMTFPWFQPDVLSAAPLRALAKEYGIGLTIHLHDQVNPFEFSPEMRRAHLENVDFALGLAKTRNRTRAPVTGDCAPVRVASRRCRGRLRQSRAPCP